MPTAHAVCLLGFSDFERQALSAHFRLALHRTPAYVLVAKMEQARFLVVDGDSAAATGCVLQAGRVADTVFIGHHAADGALARLPRPIDALHVLRELDTALLLTLRPTARAPAATAASAQAEVAAGGPRTRPARLHAPSQLSELADLFPDRVESPREARSAIDSGFDALMVDDSDIALRFLEQRLADLGIRARGVTDSDSALTYLARHRYPLVFVDVELGDGSRLDGLSLCQHIKRNAGVAAAPIVAMVSAHVSPTDRVRGSLAGCDAYLGKPLVLEELAAVVARHRRAKPRPATTAR